MKKILFIILLLLVSKVSYSQYFEKHSGGSLNGNNEWTGTNTFSDTLIIKNPNGTALERIFITDADSILRLESSAIRQILLNGTATGFNNEKGWFYSNPTITPTTARTQFNIHEFGGTLTATLDSQYLVATKIRGFYDENGHNGVQQIALTVDQHNGGVSNFRVWGDRGLVGIYVDKHNRNVGEFNTPRIVINQDGEGDADTYGAGNALFKFVADDEFGTETYGRTLFVKFVSSDTLLYVTRGLYSTNIGKFSKHIDTIVTNLTYQFDRLHVYDTVRYFEPGRFVAYVSEVVDSLNSTDKVKYLRNEDQISIAHQLQNNTTGFTTSDGFRSRINGLNSFSINLENGTHTIGTNASTTQIILNADNTVSFGGAISIGNTVNSVSPTAPNRTVTMVIGGTTYYIHAKTTND